MEKLELAHLVKDKFKDKDVEIIYNEGDLTFTVNGVALPNNRAVVNADFEIGGTDFMHTVRFVIKCVVSVHGDYDAFLEAVNNINASISTGKYFLEGEGDNAEFCCSYDTTFFNTEFEKMNVNRTMMFMFESLLLEYSGYLSSI